MEVQVISCLRIYRAYWIMVRVPERKPQADQFHSKGWFLKTSSYSLPLIRSLNRRLHMAKDIYIQPLQQKGDKLSRVPAENSLIHSFNFHSHLRKSLKLYANWLLIMCSGREQVEIVPKTANQETKYVCLLLLNEIIYQNKRPCLQYRTELCFHVSYKIHGSGQHKALECLYFYSQKNI